MCRIPRSPPCPAGRCPLAPLPGTCSVRERTRLWNAVAASAMLFHLPCPAALAGPAVLQVLSGNDQEVRDWWGKGFSGGKNSLEEGPMGRRFPGATERRLTSWCWLVVLQAGALLAPRLYEWGRQRFSFKAHRGKCCQWWCLHRDGVWPSTCPRRVRINELYLSYDRLNGDSFPCTSLLTENDVYY